MAVTGHAGDPMREALVILLTYVPLALLRGWAISLLWGWYVVDYFDAPPLTIVQAVGLGILTSLFTARIPLNEERERDVIENVIWLVITPLLALVFGWAWSLFR